MSISNKDIKHPKLSYFGIEKDAIMRFYLYRKPNVIFRTLIRNNPTHYNLTASPALTLLLVKSSGLLLMLRRAASEASCCVNVTKPYSFDWPRGCDDTSLRSRITRACGQGQADINTRQTHVSVSVCTYYFWPRTRKQPLKSNSRYISKSNNHILPIGN